MSADRVANVLTADTRRDISDLLNAAAAEHGFDPVGFLGGLIGESNLHEHAVRERAWPDVSYGLSQPTVAYLHPDSGLPLERDNWGRAIDTPENRELVRAWAHEAGNLIPYTARRYAELIERFTTGGDPLRTWTRWNAPGRTLEENAVAQPHAVANYRRGLAEAEKYRAREEVDMAGIIDLRGKLPILRDRGPHWPILDYGRRPLDRITGVVVHFTDGPVDGTVRAIAEHQISDAAARQTGTRPPQPFPAIAYHYAVKGDGTCHLLHDLTVETWHAGPANDDTVAIVYTGKGPPNAAQLAGIARCFADAERRCGRALALSGHKEHVATNCPGDWPRWRQDLMDAIGRARRPPSPPPGDNAALYKGIRDAFGEVIAAAQEGIRLTLPVSQGGPDIPDAEAIGGIAHACDVIDQHRLEALDLAAQVRV